MHWPPPFAFTTYLQVLTGDPLTLHGEGTQTRDFISVDNIVRAMELLGYEPSTASRERLTEVIKRIRPNQLPF